MCPMTQVDDLSRSVGAFDQNTSLTVVVEMSEASWLVMAMVPGVDRHPLKKLEPDPDALLRLVERWRSEAEKTGRTIERVALAYEAGRDGFWLARWLRVRGIEVHVIHSTSVAVSCEGGGSHLGQDTRSRSSRCGARGAYKKALQAPTKPRQPIL